MALAPGTIFYNGRRCKIFNVNCLDNDAPANLTIQWSTIGSTFQGDAEPTEVAIACVASVADTAVKLAVTALSKSSITIRKLTPAGANANAKSFRITVRVPRGIAG